MNLEEIDHRKHNTRFYEDAPVYRFARNATQAKLRWGDIYDLCISSVKRIVLILLLFTSISAQAQTDSTLYKAGEQLEQSAKLEVSSLTIMAITPIMVKTLTENGSYASPAEIYLISGVISLSLYIAGKIKVMKAGRILKRE